MVDGQGQWGSALGLLGQTIIDNLKVATLCGAVSISVLWRSHRSRY